MSTIIAVLFCSHPILFHCYTFLYSFPFSYRFLVCLWSRHLVNLLPTVLLSTCRILQIVLHLYVLPIINHERTEVEPFSDLL